MDPKSANKGKKTAKRYLFAPIAYNKRNVAKDYNPNCRKTKRKEWKSLIGLSIKSGRIKKSALHKVIDNINIKYLMSFFRNTICFFSN